jgi:hypothetical protein
MDVSRRGFLGLAGVATAATFLTRFPMFPREQVVTLPSGPKDWGKIVDSVPLMPAPKLELGLMRTQSSELKAIGYFRQPTAMVLENGRGIVKATFPTVTRGTWKVRYLGIWRDDVLMYVQRIDGGVITLTRGTTLEGTVTIDIEMMGWTLAGKRELERAMFGVALS